MPIATCLFCGEVKPVCLFFRVCDACWLAEPDAHGRLIRLIREEGLKAKGSLVLRDER